MQGFLRKILITFHDIGSLTELVRALIIAFFSFNYHGIN